MVARCVALLLGVLCVCAPSADEQPEPSLPPPSAVKAAGKAMLTTRGFLHPDDPPGTWRARRPHGKLIEPCSDWIPNGPPITDEYNKAPGPKLMYLSWTALGRPGLESVSATSLRAEYGAPHPGTRAVVVGQAAPLGPHWTWTFKRGPGPIFIAEAQPDGFVQFHYALLGRSANGAGNSASFFAECLVERYGTPGW